MRALSLAIVGVRYPNKRGPDRGFEMKLCKPGERIDLIPEPKNKHDDNAIAIFSCRGVQLGYVTAERAPLVLKLMAEADAVKAVFQGVADTGAWVRVTFDGSEPIVAEERDQVGAKPTSHGDDGFWPDEPGSEWGA